ncbi:MAG: glycine zipper 2TM domain-containing protein [Phycisphaerales bacterium]|nr:MAG: glycine zipper 2TM domain-containing protein [Phycisphaerales bacterium]
MRKAQLQVSLTVGGIFAIVVAGCATAGRTGALAGGGIGALAGQAIGGDTESTLIGAAVGTGVGYIIGNEVDKKHAAELNQTSQAHDYTHKEVGDLGGTRWQLVSLAPKDRVPPYASKFIEFRPHGRVITTTTNRDGTVDVVDERYRVVDDTLIVNKPGYIINARYGFSRDQLIVSAEDFRAVLKRMR